MSKFYTRTEHSRADVRVKWRHSIVMTSLDRGDVSKQVKSVFLPTGGGSLLLIVSPSQHWGWNCSAPFSSPTRGVSRLVTKPRLAPTRRECGQRSSNRGRIISSSNLRVNPGESEWKWTSVTVLLQRNSGIKIWHRIFNIKTWFRFCTIENWLRLSIIKIWLQVVDEVGGDQQRNCCFPFEASKWPICST